ncbi:hypothetical protein AgCh_033961 [Apium graveolens]
MLAPVTYHVKFVEVVVPRSAVPAIYGDDGGCLKQIRELQRLREANPISWSSYKSGETSKVTKGVILLQTSAPRLFLGCIGNLSKYRAAVILVVASLSPQCHFVPSHLLLAVQLQLI